jgi:transposase
VQGFYQRQPAYRLSQDLGVDIKVVTRVYQRMRAALYHLTELEAGKLKGEIELDEAYFGGRCKGKRGRAAAGKSVVFGLLERDERVYTKVVESGSAEELMQHIQAKTRNGSVYFTDAFRGYQSLKRYGRHHVVLPRNQATCKPCFCRY